MDPRDQDFLAKALRWCTGASTRWSMERSSTERSTVITGRCASITTTVSDHVLQDSVVGPQMLVQRLLEKWAEHHRYVIHGDGSAQQLPECRYCGFANFPTNLLALQPDEVFEFAERQSVRWAEMAAKLAKRGG